MEPARRDQREPGSTWTDEPDRGRGPLVKVTYRWLTAEIVLRACVADRPVAPHKRGEAQRALLG